MCSTATPTACSCSRAASTRRRPREQGAQLAATLNAALARYIVGRWRVQSRSHSKFEKLYLKLVPAKGAQQHARREQALRRAAPGPEPGQERERGRVRRHGSRAPRLDARSRSRFSASSTSVSSPISRSMPISRTSCSSVRAGALDDTLVYRKNLRKGAEEYTATTPPHVAAARKSGRACWPFHQLRDDHRRRRSPSTTSSIRWTASTTSRSR